MVANEEIGTRIQFQFHATTEDGDLLTLSLLLLWSSSSSTVPGPSH